MLLLVALISMLAGCTAPPTTGPAPSASARPARPDASLRIANDGRQDIAGLVVLFPGPTAEAPARRVVFGDVSAGQTTEYRPVAGGVYRYAAYEYTVGGHAASQKVTDWVGEVPLPEVRYTYHVRFDAAKASARQIELITVEAD
jgi:hypothetical protein